MELFDRNTSQFVLALGVLLGVLTLGYYLVRGLRRAMVEAEPASDKELLKPLQEAYEAGSMDLQEFQRIQRLLLGDKAAPAQRRNATPAPPASELGVTPGREVVDGPQPPTDAVPPPADSRP